MKVTINGLEVELEEKDEVRTCVTIGYDEPCNMVTVYRIVNKRRRKVLMIDEDDIKKGETNEK
jgi:hypothetical protein